MLAGGRRDDLVGRARSRRRAWASCPARCRCTPTPSRGGAPVYLAAVADGTLPPGWIADDGVGLLFRDMALERVVSARPRARAARDLVDGAVVETPIEPDLIAPAPRGVPADVRELRATRYGSRRD